MDKLNGTIVVTQTSSRGTYSAKVSLDGDYRLPGLSPYDLTRLVARKVLRRIEPWLASVTLGPVELSGPDDV